ncbi:DUF5954 family protein [Streptomyces sp. NRRL F-5123]|uniref:DUF5954 family protein n=1 Tax=Streptomyces sp. NRRL F-5123 TaxID=1463856 RepID=UPI00069440A8|nr:DUF5954 family protein [Streptomyces sp. NRRL F-5123]
MAEGIVGPDRMWPVVVRYPDGPVEEVVEADALDAARHAQTLMVRGPLFGVAVQDEGGAARWRVVTPVTAATGQDARDSLNSLLWFRARDETQDRAERRALLAAVARLETERVDELTVLGRRYRVVRAEEYAGAGPEGIEGPRPTDAEPAVVSWDRSASDAAVDDGLVLDAAAPVTPTQAAERFAMRGLAYSGARYPQDVLRDAARAVTDHPDVVLLPTTFRVLRQRGDTWTIDGGLHCTAHEARRSLEFGLTWFEPRKQGIIDFDADRDVDARSLVAAGSHPAADRLSAFVRAADRLREHADEIEVDGTVRRICRMRRLVRWGPDGPEQPRPSDTDIHPPERIHPFLDEDGTVHH